tara:strand:+ start:1069 stop:1494 length:426 start_codon:yes stop_codon:yes gene_type:complete
MSDYTIEELQQMLNNKIKQEEKKSSSEIIDGDLEINFNLDDLINSFTLHYATINDDDSRSEYVSNEILDDDGYFNMKVINDYAEKYILQKVQSDVRYGRNYLLEDLDIDMNIQWTVDVKTLKKINNTNVKPKVKLPKLKKL